MNLVHTSTFVKNIQAIISFAVTVCALIAAGVLGYQSLAEKPTRQEVDVQMSQVRAETTAMQDTLDKQGRQIERVMRVQDFQIEQSNWQGEVLDHIAQKQKSPVPSRPPRLNELRAGLLSAQ